MAVTKQSYLCFVTLRKQAVSVRENSGGEMMRKTKSIPVFILQRILQVIPIVLGTIFITFLLLDLSGDPITALGGEFA